MKTRLDAELVRRELARSRENAVELIAAGKVLVNGIPATKAATQVDAQISITLKDEQAEFVSRGGHKLAGALDHFANLVVVDKVALDAGASTGGFTDVLLKRGVKKVVAADVGYGQLAWQLQSDNRVKILDRVNVRSLTKEQVAEEIDLVVADLSFISLKIVLPALIAVGDAALRKEAVAAVAAAAFSLGLGCLGVVASPLPGPSGNVEYFLWLSKAGQALLEVDLDLAIERGPA